MNDEWKEVGKCCRTSTLIVSNQSFLALYVIMVEFDQCGIFAAKISYKLSLIRTRISKVGLRVGASHGPGQIACNLCMQFDAIC